jgi:rare lipoprotein A
MFALLMAMTYQLPAEAQEVVASWYEQPGKMANGKMFKPNALTAAHKTLPFGTRLKLRYKDRKIEVKITDRGPYIRGRSLDLSKGAAKKLGFTGVGKIEVLATLLPEKKKI